MVLAAFLLGLPMLGSTVAFAAITSLATIGLYISEFRGVILEKNAVFVSASECLNSERC
jgi:hypothetical protein